MNNYESDYLAHHGIKGQKWGVRRFQNPDGTRTRLGRLRERNAIDHDKLMKSTNPKELYANRNQLSDAELQNRLNRIRNEEQLKSLTQKPNKGKRIVNELLSNIGKKSVQIFTGAVVAATATAIVAKGQEISEYIIDNLDSVFDSVYGKERWVI